MQKNIFLTFVLVLVSARMVNAQSLHEFYMQSLDINKSGMYFLGGWAVANMATGTYGWLTHQGDKKYFHQMNAAWNVVNLAIAGYALWDALNTDVFAFREDEIMQRHIRTENIFLINAGLDVLYMAAGAWLIRASSGNEKRHDLLKGYGQSVILQGAFLFVFDLVKFGFQYNHRQGFINSISSVGLSPEGISLTFSF
jgi:hypothetical protein